MRLERAADEWTNDLDALLDRIGPRFGRAEPRQRARVFVRGVLSGLRRKNGWTLAHFAGDDDPNGMQRLLNAARWDVDGVRDDVRQWVVEHLGDRPRGVLVAHESAFPKKGSRSVGVHRQYSERTARVENVQIGAFLTYVGPRGAALVDRYLYLPESWLADETRARLAGIPAGTPFATRPEVVRLMVERALQAQVPARWVAADDAYGDARALRTWLDERDVPYVLATTREDRVATASGHVAEVHDLAATLPRGAWERRSAAGRIQEWARIPLAGFGTVNGHRFERCLLLRRTPGEREQLTYYRCRIPAGTQLAELIRVARAPVAADECLNRARRALGLGQYQVRRYDAWYRHVTLCMVAGAHLAAWSAVESAGTMTGTAAALSPPASRYRTVSVRGRAV